MGSFNIAFRIFIIERWTFGGIHWPLDPARLIPQGATTIGQEEGGRPASSRNQILGTIVYSRASKIQHNDSQRAGLINRSQKPRMLLRIQSVNGSPVHPWL